MYHHIVADDGVVQDHDIGEDAAVAANLYAVANHDIFHDDGAVAVAAVVADVKLGANYRIGIVVTFYQLVVVAERVLRNQDAFVRGKSTSALIMITVAAEFNALP